MSIRTTWRRACGLRRSRSSSSPRTSGGEDLRYGARPRRRRSPGEEKPDRDLAGERRRAGRQADSLPAPTLVERDPLVEVIDRLTGTKTGSWAGGEARGR